MRDKTCPVCSVKLPSGFDGELCLKCANSSDTAETIAPAGQKFDTEAANDVTVKPSNSVPPSQNRERASELVGTEFGDYELLDEIARGGMGVVFRARQKSLDRLVALKMILDGSLASQVEIDRFKIEAQAAAHLDHPGIVQVYEIGEIEGRHFFSMALIDGQSLANRIETGPVPPNDAAELMLEIVSAMDFAHQRGVIHRDLKPANILLDSNGRPKITDFGLAKRPDRDRQLTMTGQMLGTPSYMAPEQAQGKEVFEATDVYALGAILYAMLAGQPPFRGPTVIDTLTKVIDQEPVPLRQSNASVPLDLDTICLKCLEKDPKERYESASELAAELKRFISGEEILARPLTAIGKVFRWRRIIARNNDVRLQSQTKIAGFPLVDIAFGRDKEKGEEFGHAKGIVAIGDRATGVFAYGGFARGVFAIGLYAAGLVACGMYAFGVASAGFIGLGIFASGGLAIGYMSFGFLTVGVWSIGMFSFGWKALGAYSWSLVQTGFGLIRKLG